MSGFATLAVTLLAAAPAGPVVPLVGEPAPAGGRIVCSAIGSQQAPTLVTDGAGGAIVTWQDGRNFGLYDVYAQHVLATGAVDPA